MTLGESFDQVLAAARLGEEWAWSAIYVDLAPVVRGYLRGRGAADPDDLTGEAFLGVVSALGSFEGGERQFRTWVLTIAHRRLIDARRRGSRRVDPIPLDDRVEEAEQPGGDVEREALDRLGTGAMEAALQGLSPDQQAVLLLRVVADLTVDEVAAVLDKRPGAVKALQRRGLAALERAISSGAVTL